MAFIVDSSVVAAWAIEDEKCTSADLLLGQAQIEGIVCPMLLWYEIRNVLVVSERRNRISAKDSDEFLERLEQIPTQTSQMGTTGHTVRLARLHQLSAYDATYLELAMRCNLPLATFDQRLSRAAKIEGVTVYPA